MAEELGDLVEGWITHNEPWVVAFLGHATGVKAPGVRDWPTALTVAHHLLVSHGLAVDAVRAGARAGVPVGITLNLTPMRAASATDADRDAAWRMDGHQNRWFLDPVLRGSYPADLLAHYERRFGPLRVATSSSWPRGRSTSSASTTTRRRSCGRHRPAAPLCAEIGGRVGAADGDGLAGRRAAGCTTCSCGCGATTAT